MNLLNEDLIQINIFKDENVKLMTKINELNENNEALLSDNKKLKKEIESNKSLIESLQQTMNANLLQINEYMNKNEELLKKIKQLQSNKKGNTSGKGGDNDKLSLTVSAQKEEIKDLQNLIQNLNMEKQNLISIYTKEIDELKNENETKNKELNNLKEKIKNLENNKALSNTQSDKDKNEAENLKQKLSEMEKNQKILEEKIESNKNLDKELEKCKKEL